MAGELDNPSFAGIARPPGVYSAANSSFITGPGTLTVTTGPATDYAGWETFHGITGGQSGDDDDDGMSNFAEYAFGLDPKNGTSVQAVTGMPAPSSGTFTYTRRKGSLTGLSYEIWTSTNLTDWEQDFTVLQVPTAIPGAENESVEVTLGPASLNVWRLFVRVGVN